MVPRAEILLAPQFLGFGHVSLVWALLHGVPDAGADAPNSDVGTSAPAEADAGTAPEEAAEAVAPDAGVPAPRVQLSVLEGRVQTRGTRDPIAVASVVAGDKIEETDAEGRFELELPPGPQQVHVSAPGHVARVFDEVLEPGQKLTVVYRLERGYLLPYETRVRDQRARTEVARAQLRSEEAHETPGTMGEPLRSVMQLPGVASVVSGLAYPVVRGTEPAATAYFLDGVRIPQLFHALAGPSVIHPDFIDQVDFYAGVAPARFGRLLGGAIDATVARPSDKLSVTGSIDLINASALVQLPIVSTGTSVTLAARASYTPLVGAKLASALIPATPGEPPTSVVANFYDYQARVVQKFGSGRLRLLAFGSSDAVGTEPNGGSLPTGVFSALFHRIDLLWQQPVKVGTFEVGGTWGRDVTTFDGDQGRMRYFDIDLARTLFSGRMGWSASFDNGLTVRAGVDVEVDLTTTAASGVAGAPMPGFTMVPMSSSSQKANGVIDGVYLQARWARGPLETLAGVRADLYTKQPDITWGAVAPRLEERLKLSDTFSARAAVGLFNQPPTLSLNFPTSDVSHLDEGLQWAAHSEVGFDVRLPLGIEVGVTGFYNPLFRTVEHSVTELLFPTGASPVTNGTAYGTEVFVRRAAAGRWFGWVAATLQRSERVATIYRFGDDGTVLGRLQATIPSSFDQTLILHAVLGVRLPRGWSAGASLHFNTGRPEDGSLSSRTQRVAYDANGEPYWTPQDLDRVARLPSYFRADVRVTKTWAFDDWQLEAYLDVLNASLTREVLAYSYTAANGQLGQAPLDVPIVLPMLGVKGRY
jgi:hypothetical protein